MPKVSGKHLIGDFIVDQSGKIVSSKLAERAHEPTEEAPIPLLAALRDPKYRESLRTFNLEVTSKKIRDAVSVDNFISQAINTVSDLDRISNTLSKRLREWYALYNPEFERALEGNAKFAELASSKSKKDLLREIRAEGSMGKDLDPQDLEEILGLARTLNGLFIEKQKLHDYLDSLLSSHAPNLKTLAGTSIAAKLIEHTGTLKKLMLLPASTIQILGAEKALFRHLTTGARPPKFGYIMHHNFVASARREDKGRRARLLADKLAIAARVDYFKGKYIADSLFADMEKKALVNRRSRKVIPDGKLSAEGKQSESLPRSQERPRSYVPRHASTSTAKRSDSNPTAGNLSSNPFFKRSINDSRTGHQPSRESYTKRGGKR